MKIIIVLLLCLPSISFGRSFDFKEWGNIDISGYAGYRYIYSSVGLFPLDSGPELGLLFNWEMNKNWTIFTQFSYENENPLNHPLVYGFLEYKKHIFKDTSIKLQGGLLRYEVGLFNDQRINPRTRPGGTVEAHAIYHPKLRRILSSGAGLKAAVTYKDVSIAYTYAAPEILNQVEEAKIWASSPTKTLESNFGGMQIVNFHYHPSNQNWLYKSTWFRANLGKGNGNNQAFFAGVEYIGSNFDTSLEFLAAKITEFKWIRDFSKNIGYGLYVRGDYDVNNWFSIRAGYSHYIPPPDISRTIRRARGTQKAVLHQDDIGIGFTIYKNSLEFKTDVHYVSGGNFLESKDWDTTKNLNSWWYIGTSLVFYFN